jgi:2',3'-cyclic-nucleotide 2'-phosphodiesterase (5'-nucleotidase family)
MSKTKARRVKDHSEENGKMKKEIKNWKEKKEEYLRRPEIPSSRRRLRWKSTT